jgi:hypothetical protein
MQLRSGAQRRTGENLQRLANSTLAVSFKQESLSNRLREQVATDQTSDARSLANEQQKYTRAVEQIADELYEIAKKSMAVTDAILRPVGEAIDNMRNSMIFLEQNKAFMSTASASQAVTSLNRATIELLTTAQSCMAGTGGGAGQMSQLQQLLNQQQQILQESQALLQMRATQERMLQERQAAIERLAGQQRSLAQMAEQMGKDLKDNKRVLGRMDKIMEEMEEVIRDLDSGILDDQTVRNMQRGRIRRDSHHSYSVKRSGELCL